VGNRATARNDATFLAAAGRGRLNRMSYPTAREVVRGHDLSHVNVIVTGATSGLGAHTVEVLAAAGARVVAAGRRPGTAGLPATAEFRRLDLASLASVNEFVRRWDRPTTPITGAGRTTRGKRTGSRRPPTACSRSA